MINYIKPGNIVTRTAPGGGVVSSEGYLIGALFVIAAADAAAGEEFEGQTVGVFTLDKVSAQAWSEGDQIFWNDGAKEATNVGPADAYIGTADAAALNPSATGRVRLDGTGQSVADPPASATIFVSTQQTGTGAAQTIAHGLGVIPSAVTVQVESGHDGAAGQGDLTPLVDSDGAHDITNVEVTVTSGALFKVTAYV